MFREGLLVLSRKIKTSNYFVRYIQERISKNKNFLCVFVGSTGSGKSYGSLRLAELLDPKFDENRICFNVEQFLNLLEQGNLYAGAVIIVEETQVMSNARNWQSQTNKILNIIFSTFRCLNYIVIFNTPDLGFVDKQQRKLLHSVIETTKIDFSRNLLYVKPKFIQNNPITGKIYTKYLRVHHNGSLKTIKLIGFSKPSKNLLKIYEKAKTEFVNKQIKEQMKKLEKMKEKPKTPQDKREVTAQRVKSIAEEVKQNVQNFKGKRGAINLSKIMAIHHIGRGLASQVRALIEIESDT